jgi:hypothetical protein
MLENRCIEADTMEKLFFEITDHHDFPRDATEKKFVHCHSDTDGNHAKSPALADNL